jgi:hypothetical protein
MKRVVAASWGVFCVIFGVVAFAWVSYLLFVDNREHVTPSGFIKGYALAVGAVGVGVWRIRGGNKQPAASPKDSSAR